MVVETQNDNEPLQRRVYTMKQLEREIPIGAELLRDANIPVPRRLQFPIPRELGFRTVLPNPADLGLLPPSATLASVTHNPTRDSNSSDSSGIHRRLSNRRRRGRRGTRSTRSTRGTRGTRADAKDLELIVRDTDARKGRNLFQLPTAIA